MNKLKGLLQVVLLLVTLNLYSQDNSFIILGVRVYDGDRTISETNVVVREGIINSIGPTLVADDLPQIDGNGLTLIPGFIDAHTHTESIEQLNQCLKYGVTTVLDMGTFPEHNKTLREAAASRNDVADFRSSGIFITPPGGHGTEFGYAIPTITGPDEAEAFVNEQVELGADYLKIVINGVRNQRSGTPTLDSATVFALVDAGHKQNKLVVAHVESANDVKLAVNAGADGLVHSWRDSGARPDLAQLIAGNGVFVIANDIAIRDGILNSGPKQLLTDELISPYLSDAARQDLMKTRNAQNELTMQTSYERLQSLVDAGVLLLSGTDAFTGNPRVVHGATYHRLLELLVQAGISPQEVLQMSTSRIADVFNLNDRGRIKPGLHADLILIEGNPTTDILDTRKISKIWRNGLEVRR